MGEPARKISAEEDALQRRLVVLLKMLRESDAAVRDYLEKRNREERRGASAHVG